MQKNGMCRLYSMVLVISLIVSCSFVNSPSVQQKSITLMTYNTQTFFDAVEDGTEFADFKGSSSRWTPQKYSTRLNRLAETAYLMEKKLSDRRTLPDILVLQEIENQWVIEDFCKRLPRKDVYPYILCSPVQDQASFTTVVLSKYPIEDFRIHTLQTVHDSYAASLRPLTEVILNVGSEDEKKLIKVFSVHWKSKRGKNGGQTIRTLQEEQLIQKIADTIVHSAVPVIACGDFNQEYEAFSGMQQFSVCWNLFSSKNEKRELQPAGSYYFRNQWEKIDHIFYVDASYHNKIDVQKFLLLCDEPLLKNGIPARYDVRTGQGYSDHLPIGIRFIVP